MKDTKVRIERSKFDVDCALDYTEFAAGTGTSFNSTLSLPIGLKPSDFIGKILHFSSTESNVLSMTFEVTSIITLVSTIRMTVSNTLQENTYGVFTMSFMGDLLPGELVYNAKTGQANIVIVLAAANEGGGA